MLQMAFSVDSECVLAGFTPRDSWVATKGTVVAWSQNYYGQQLCLVTMYQKFHVMCPIPFKKANNQVEKLIIIITGHREVCYTCTSIHLAEVPKTVMPHLSTRSHMAA